MVRVFEVVEVLCRGGSWWESVSPLTGVQTRTTFGTASSPTRHL